MPIAGSTLAFSDIIGAVSSLVTSSVTWLTSVVNGIVASPLLSFWALIGLVGVGIGLYHRLAR